MNDLYLSTQPRRASPDLDHIWLFVKPAFTARRRLPFEMFHDICHVSLFSIDAGLFQSTVKKAARGTDKGVPFDVLFITGNFTDEHQVGRNFSLTKNRLRADLIKLTALTIGGRISQRRICYSRRKEIKRTS